MKQWPALLLAFASLITALAGLVTAIREPKARAAYEQHAKDIEAAQSAVASNHQDLERLSTFVASQPPQVIVYDPAPPAPASSVRGSGGMGGSPPPQAAASATPPMPKPLKIPAPPRAFDSL